MENFFDLKKQGTEYREFRPYSKYWDREAFNNKIKNITKVIKDLNCDIVALQEIESEIALKSLMKNLKSYRYYKFLKNRNSAIGLALISRYPIVKTKKIVVNRYDKYSRYILKATILIENKKLIVYVNHWRSKRAKESKRIIYATALKDDIKLLPKNSDYIILGDLNSNYDEYQTFKYDRKLNNTYGITGINQILNTTIDGNYIKMDNILKFDKMVHYNPWIDINNRDRFSLKFRGSYDTPDNMILSRGLFDEKNISYKPYSFKVFKPSYLYKKGQIKRWNMRKKDGFSDHLPIYATFTTKPFKKNSYTKKANTTKDINYLYTIEKLDQPIVLKDIIVIYKTKNIAIIKQQNKRAIVIYNKNVSKLKVGNIYNITAIKIQRYNGLKEITNIANIKKISTFKNYKDLYIDMKKKPIDLFDERYQNEMIKNLTGTYKKGYLYFYYKNRLTKIKIYFKNKNKRYKDGQNITINNGHLSTYKSKVQIVIY